MLPLREVGVETGQPYTGSTECSVADCRIDGLNIRAQASTSQIDWGTVQGSARSNWSNPRVGKLTSVNPSWPQTASPFSIDPDQDPKDDGLPYFVGIKIELTPQSFFRLLQGSALFAAGAIKKYAAVVVKPPEVPVGTVIFTTSAAVVNDNYIAPDFDSKNLQLPDIIAQVCPTS